MFFPKLIKQSSSSINYFFNKYLFNTVLIISWCIKITTQRVWTWLSSVFCLTVSHKPVISVLDRAVVPSEGSAGEELFPSSFKWLLARFSSSRPIELRESQVLEGWLLAGAILSSCHMSLTSIAGVIKFSKRKSQLVRQK